MSRATTRPQRRRPRRGRRVLLQAVQRRAGQGQAGLRELRHRRATAEARPDREPRPRRHAQPPRRRSRIAATTCTPRLPGFRVRACSPKKRSERPAASPHRTRSGSPDRPVRSGRSTPCSPTRRCSAPAPNIAPRATTPRLASAAADAASDRTSRQYLPAADDLPKPGSDPVPLPRRLLAEFVGTGATRRGGRRLRDCRPATVADDVGLQLLGELDRHGARPGRADPAVRTGVRRPLQSCCHGGGFAVWVGAPGTGISASDAAATPSPRPWAAVVGAVLANVMFDRRVSRSPPKTASRSATCREIVATAGLIALIFALARSRPGRACRRPRSAHTSAPPTGSPARRRSPIPPSPSVGCSPTLSPGSPRAPRRVSLPRRSSAD